ncbi:DUF3310 domain-containing protein [Weissella viridescens]|uniref:DUF3310 domain-containing protein n=1 Tax=Weissella viridescens TaxID=1629 RepID=UPI003AF26343
MSDPVENPKCYQLSSGKELKDVLPDLLGNEGTVAAYKFNTIKYLTRFQDKNGHEDLMKAIEYIKMIDELVYSTQGFMIYGNNEPQFEVEKPKKYVVRSIDHDGDKHYKYLIYSEDTDLPMYEIGYDFDPIVKFDTREEAEKWTNPQTEVIEVEE